MGSLVAGLEFAASFFKGSVAQTASLHVMPNTISDLYILGTCVNVPHTREGFASNVSLYELLNIIHGDSVFNYLKPIRSYHGL